MHILIAGTTYYPAVNGQAIFTINLAEGLARHGHEVLMITHSMQEKPYKIIRNGVKIYGARSISLTRWNPGAYLSLFPGEPVRQVFRYFRPDVVHIQDHYPISWSIANLGREYAIPLAGTNHFMPENLAPYLHGVSWFKPGFNWVLWKWMLTLYNQLSVATAPSRTAAEILRKNGLQTPVFPISCGVDQHRFRPMTGIDRREMRQRYGLNPNRNTLLFVGRVDGEKRIDLLLQALHLIDRDDIQLAVAGRGAAMSALKKLAQDLDLEDRVRFTGYVPDADLPGLLNSVDVFAMPSEAELLSIASLEALSCGRPIIAANSQALPELVDQGFNGYLFNPGDIRDAARVIQLIISQKDRWPEMQAASLDKVRTHSLDYTLNRYEQVYELMLSGALQPDQGGQPVPQPQRSIWAHPLKSYAQEVDVHIKKKS
jgi:1,2-diacylglycerol 3-alpha-glucosyltransferase